jgi:thiamine biosynthesis lipoprotein
VAPPTLSVGLKPLEARGLVRHDDRRFLVLTAGGERIAQQVHHRFAVIRAFLGGVLGIPDRDALAEACLLEHGISDATTERLLDLLKLLREDRELREFFQRRFAEYQRTCRASAECSTCDLACMSGPGRGSRGLMRRAALVMLALVLAPAAMAARTPRTAGMRASAPAARAERARELMGTICTAQAEAADTVRAGVAIDEAFDVVATLDSVMSSWNEASELQRLNARAAADRVACSEDLFAAIQAGLQAAGETDGAFDPTIEPLDRVWDMRGAGREPEPGELSDARRLVGWHMVVLDPGRRTVHFLKPGMGIDLGGIGKGYALDRAVETLRARRVTRALVNFGGEIIAMTNHEPWQVLVADPADRLQPVLRLSLSNGAISTSGQSERTVIVHGEPRGHIFDPHLGEPVASRASVSVVARSAMRADALSTALFVMGRARAFDFAREHPDIGVLWLEPDGDGVKAWVMNLTALAAEPGARIQWMRDP